MTTHYTLNTGPTLADQVTDTGGKNAFIPSVKLVDGTGAAAGGVASVSPTTYWAYASPTGGLTDTSDATAKAASGAGIRNYVGAIQAANSSATASEIVIKDGASTVLWRGYLPATSGTLSVRFDPPLRGTANTATVVAMITTGTATRVSIQGYTGA